MILLLGFFFINNVVCMPNLKINLCSYKLTQLGKLSRIMEYLRQKVLVRHSFYYLNSMSFCGNLKAAESDSGICVVRWAKFRQLQIKKLAYPPDIDLSSHKSIRPLVDLGLFLALDKHAAPNRQLRNSLEIILDVTKIRFVPFGEWCEKNNKRDGGIAFAAERRICDAPLTKGLKFLFFLFYNSECLLETWSCLNSVKWILKFSDLLILIW
ncbi:hypothetical protein EGR_08897 [Echinococcus granulosus]|uniref:Uncharacterized protein n=1 Tax=Echinococcus granulosus TaxID=6210 RepID=W6U534_ECHGR|nr:hypothetical protein EGR_08897 [Echinococcus granulosus]EUB56235.1 hypothetical protein EGR_08897 [Echinococcus granulosus]